MHIRFERVVYMEKPGAQKEEFRIEGRTVREIEKYLAAKPLNYSGRILKALLMFLAAGLILILPVSIIWDLRQDSAALRAQVASLQEENDMLKKQIAGRMQLVNPAQSKEETLPRNSDSSGLQPGGYINHRVQSGESLSHISKRYYDTIRYSEYLARINGLSVNSQLNVGQIIKVPVEPDQSQKN